MSSAGDEVTKRTSPTGRHACGVCPASHADWLSLPLRRIWTDPGRILRGLVAEGQTVADLGCGPGFFTLPIARMVGPHGHVVAVDLQAGMLAKLQARAERAGLDARISLHECAVDSLGELPPVDFALAFFMVHEVPDRERLFGEVHAALKPHGCFLLVEPWGHVGAAAFAATVEAARGAGLRPLRAPKIAFSRAMLFERG